MSGSLLDPISLHFLLHDCDLHSIHPGILGEWNPVLKQTIINWINIGSGGDPTPFQSHFVVFRDAQVRIQPFLGKLPLTIMGSRSCVCMIETKNLMTLLLAKWFIMPLLAQNQSPPGNPKPPERFPYALPQWIYLFRSLIFTLLLILVLMMMVSLSGLGMVDPRQF